ncbi:MAG: hypothetical protein R3F56_10445 [Planctomycetota bacterium]
MTLLRELIHIPEQVHRGDFVLKVNDGVRHPDATLATCSRRSSSWPATRRSRW